MNYHPLIKRKDVQAKIKRSLGWAYGILRPYRDTPVSKQAFTNYFGQTNNPLSAWLKEVLTTCTNHYYNPETHEVKQYRLNTAGAKYLVQLLNGTTQLTWSEWMDSFVPHEVHSGQDKPVLHSSPQVSSLLNNKPRTTKDTLCVLLREEEQELNDLATAQLLFDWGDQLSNGTIQYNERCFRYFHQFQSYRKAAKAQAFPECQLYHEYDIQVAAPTLLYQYAQQQGFTQQLPFLDIYLNDRQRIREEIALHANLTTTQVKKIIAAIINGAPLGTNYDWETYKQAEYNYHKMAALKSNPHIIALKQDIKKLWKFLSKDMPRTKNQFTNRTKPIQPSQKAQLYFQLERQVLNTVKQYLNQHQNCYATEHDGWVTNKPINIADLQQYIQQHTRFNVHLDYKFLG